MNKIAFFGSIYSDDYKIVATILKQWLSTDTLDLKIRLSGEEIVYDSEKVYLYCYNAVTNQAEKPSFLLEGNMSGTLDQARSFLKQLLELFGEQSIASSFEYVEVNEDGNEASDEFYIE